MARYEKLGDHPKRTRIGIDRHPNGGTPVATVNGTENFWHLMEPGDDHSWCALTSGMALLVLAVTSAL